MQKGAKLFVCWTFTAGISAGGITYLTHLCTAIDQIPSEGYLPLYLGSRFQDVIVLSDLVPYHDYLII